MRTVKDAYWLFVPIWSDAPGKDPNAIRLHEDACFRVDFSDGSSVEYWIPRHYVCDGASIPRGFWWVPGIGTPTQGDNALGAWAHDPLFLTHALSFADSNNVAFYLWKRTDKRLWACRAMWAAVSTPFARLAYRNTKEDLVALEDVRRMVESRPDKAKFESLWYQK